MIGRTFTRLGRAAVTTSREVGGIVMLAGAVLRALVPLRIDPRGSSPGGSGAEGGRGWIDPRGSSPGGSGAEGGRGWIAPRGSSPGGSGAEGGRGWIARRELAHNLFAMGNRSVAIVVLTAFFAGGLMTIQTAPFVTKIGATALVGWAAGYAVLREIGPILIGLMFSGRVGSNNTAELATMTVTEQLDGLRALAIDPVRYLIVPRVISMIVMLAALTVLGDLVALVGAAAVARLMLGIEWSIMYHSFADNLHPADFLHGVYKSLAFGAAIALSSCYFGISVRGGAVGVGRAVNAAVVAAAVSIMLLDFFLTYLTT